MAKYRKLPVTIEAFRLGYDDAPDWFLRNTNHSYSYDGEIGICVTIHTLEGDMIADKGDYIIKGINGELYPCKPDIFRRTYELEEE